MSGNLRKAATLLWFALLWAEKGFVMERKHLPNNLSFIDATDPQGTFDTGQEISLTQEARGLVLKLLSGYHRGWLTIKNTMIPMQNQLGPFSGDMW